MNREEAIEYNKNLREYMRITDKKSKCKFLKENYEALDIAIKVLEQQSEDKGEISDGYHTFNQLYHQRAMLFATIVNQNKGKAWKSFKHSDGKYCFDSNGESLCGAGKVICTRVTCRTYRKRG